MSLMSSNPSMRGVAPGEVEEIVVGDELVARDDLAGLAVGPTLR